MGIRKILPVVVGVSLYFLLTQKAYANPSQWQSIIQKYSRQYDIPQAVIYAIIHNESSGNPLSSESGYWGGQGAMGISLPTAQTYGFAGNKTQLKYANNNIHYGTAYLSYLKRIFNGNVRKMAAGYNAGPDLYPYPTHYVNKFITYYDMYAPRLGEKARAFI